MDSDDSEYFDRILEIGSSADPLTIKQCYMGDVGCVMWDAALVLCKFLKSDFFASKYGHLTDKRVIELGSGTGAVGLVASVHGAHVTITDLEEFVPLMQLNIETNKKHIQGSLTAKTLKWGEPVTDFSPVPDFILLSDCVYYLEAVDDLVQTLNDLSDSNTEILCSYEERTIGQNLQSLDQFMKRVKEIFTVDEVPLEKQDPVYCSEDIHILTMKKR